MQTPEDIRRRRCHRAQRRASSRWAVVSRGRAATPAGCPAVGCPAWAPRPPPSCSRLAPFGAGASCQRGAGHTWSRQRLTVTSWCRLHACNTGGGEAGPTRSPWGAGPVGRGPSPCQDYGTAQRAKSPTAAPPAMRPAGHRPLSHLSSPARGTFSIYLFLFLCLNSAERAQASAPLRHAVERQAFICCTRSPCTPRGPSAPMCARARLATSSRRCHQRALRAHATALAAPFAKPQPPTGQPQLPYALAEGSMCNRR